ncbi:Cytochrome c-552 [Burkholderiales bacterium]|nr:Cytochrome c-552 [Burkholderiales bacterium]
MKKLLAVALISALFSGSAMAQIELAKQKNCLACHSVDKKVLGPSYKEVAAKYANDPDAEARLVKKVREGGTGVWGKNVMPANPKLTEAEAQSLVKWILSLK